MTAKGFEFKAVLFVIACSINFPWQQLGLYTSWVSLDDAILKIFGSNRNLRLDPIKKQPV